MCAEIAAIRKRPIGGFLFPPNRSQRPRDRMGLGGILLRQGYGVIKKGPTGPVVSAIIVFLLGIWLAICARAVIVCFSGSWRFCGVCVTGTQ